MQQQLLSFAYAGNPMGHVTTASAVGGALAVIQCWFMQVVWHVTVPQDVAMAFTVVLTIFVSFVLQYLPQPKGSNLVGDKE